MSYLYASINKNLSQEELAKILNVGQQQYSKLETGVSTLNVEQLAILCNFYGVTPNDLLDIKKIYNNVMSKLDK